MNTIEAEQLIDKILSVDTSDSEKEFLINSVKILSAEILAGFRNGIFNRAIKLNLKYKDIFDTCGTGGDGKDTFNISTTAAFIIAGSGIKVAKHGNNSASSKCGSSQVINALGIQLTNNEGFLKKCLDETGMCYLHAPLFHPELKNVAAVRKNIGRKTFFNLLGPLLNPAGVTKQVIGTASKEDAELIQATAKILGLDIITVHSLDGYDEVSLTGDALLVSSNSTVVSPEDFNFEKILPESIKGSEDIQENANTIIQILANNSTKEKISVALANASLGIQVANPTLSLKQCVDIAKDSLYSGSALRVLTKLQELSR